MMGFGYGMFGIGMLIMLAFWVLVIGGIVWLVVTLVRNNQKAIPAGGPPPQTPLEVLQLRYAKGEINKEQFEQMKHDLGLS